jgi:hypothetical protein
MLIGMLVYLKKTGKLGNGKKNDNSPKKKKKKKKKKY